MTNSSSSESSKKKSDLLTGLVAYYTIDDVDPSVGKVDSVAVWNRLLTKKERAELYWMGFPPWERRIKRYFLYPTRLIHVWWFMRKVGRFLKRIW